MPRLILPLLLGTVLSASPLAADTFTLSHAPVVNDPTLTHRPTAKEWPHISLTEARHELGRDGVVFVDGRSRLEWDQSHLPGALSLPSADFENSFPLLRHRLVHAKAVICYCHGYSCGIADYLCELLTGQGLRNVAVFSGGFPAWKAAGFPLTGRGVAKPEEHALPGP